MNRIRGFTIIEIMVSLVIFSLMTLGATTFFNINRRVSLEEEIAISTQSSLRLGTTRITDSLRNGGYGVPSTSLNLWIPWVSGFSSDSVVVIEGTGTDPDSVSVASCSSQPIMTLTANAMASSTTLSVSDTSKVDIANRRLILIDESEHAHVVSIGSGTVEIDTDPSVVGNQGLTRSYPTGTPLCRIDVLSFDVDTVNKKLRRSNHDGSGFQVMLDNIGDMQIQSLSSGDQYRVTLTADSNDTDATSISFSGRSLSTTVTLKN